MKKLIAVAIAAAFSAGAYAQSAVAAPEAGATSISTKDVVAKKHHKGKKKAVKSAA